MGSEHGQVQLGAVKWFDHSKNWGFLRCLSGLEVFVHGTAVHDLLREGDVVCFLTMPDSVGLSARRVRLLRRAALSDVIATLHRERVRVVQRLDLRNDFRVSPKRQTTRVRASSARHQGPLQNAI